MIKNRYLSLKNRKTTELLIDLHNTTPRCSANKICRKKDYEEKTKDKISKNIIFFSECAKTREKETQILTAHKTFMKTHIVQQNIIYDMISVENDF